jgi:predicted nucleic acid-binding protein
VILKWFLHEEPNARPAQALRRAFEEGTLIVFVPPLLHIEVVNVAGRRWRWRRAGLVELAHALTALPFEVRNPALGAVADWTGRGLTAYDACYVALAAAEAIPLITDDELILSTAPNVARSLAEIES